MFNIFLKNPINGSIFVIIVLFIVKIFLLQVQNADPIESNQSYALNDALKRINNKTSEIDVFRASIKLTLAELKQEFVEDITYTNTVTSVYQCADRHCTSESDHQQLGEAECKR